MLHRRSSVHHNADYQPILDAILRARSLVTGPRAQALAESIDDIYDRVENHRLKCISTTTARGTMSSKELLEGKRRRSYDVSELDEEKATGEDGGGDRARQAREEVPVMRAITSELQLQNKHRKRSFWGRCKESRRDLTRKIKSTKWKAVIIEQDYSSLLQRRNFRPIVGATFALIHTIARSFVFPVSCILGSIFYVVATLLAARKSAYAFYFELATVLGWCTGLLCGCCHSDRFICKKLLKSFEFWYLVLMYFSHNCMQVYLLSMRQTYGQIVWTVVFRSVIFLVVAQLIAFDMVVGTHSTPYIRTTLLALGAVVSSYSAAKVLYETPTDRMLCIPPGSAYCKRVETLQASCLVTLAMFFWKFLYKSVVNKKCLILITAQIHTNLTRSFWRDISENKEDEGSPLAIASSPTMADAASKLIVVKALKNDQQTTSKVAPTKKNTQTAKVFPLITSS